MGFEYLRGKCFEALVRTQGHIRSRFLPPLRLKMVDDATALRTVRVAHVRTASTIGFEHARRRSLHASVRFQSHARSRVFPPFRLQTSGLVRTLCTVLVDRSLPCDLDMCAAVDPTLHYDSQPDCTVPFGSKFIQERGSYRHFGRKRRVKPVHYVRSV